ncbi:MAG: oxygenase MpaB family protein [Polyangiaceae bacterium]
MNLPERVVNMEAAREQFGLRADWLMSYFTRLDPLADAVIEDFESRRGGWKLLDRALRDGIAAVPEAPEALQALFAQLDEVPRWVDWDRIERAGRFFFRTGPAGGIVLGAKSLCYGYCSPGGNKPLIFTGKLLPQHVARRLAETGRFVVATCSPGGLRRDGEGFAATVRVRLMHAKVRRLLLRDPRWDSGRWGEPINQHDMLGTSLLFSQSFLEGIRQFGFTVTRAEADDYLHLWRYSGYLIGVAPELLPVTEPDADTFADLILMTQGAPDADSRRLIDALVHFPIDLAKTEAERRAARYRMAAGYGFCRYLLGDDLADQLDLPRDGWRHLVPACAGLIGRLEPFRRLVPPVERLYRRSGESYWDQTVTVGLEGIPAQFAPPMGLA